MVAMSSMMNTADTSANSVRWVGLSTRSVSRVVNGFFGVSLIMASLGMWLVPGSNWASELMMMKLAVSVLFFCLGVAMVQTTRHRSTTEVQLDGNNGEIRILTRGEDGIARLRNRLAYEDLSEIDLRKNSLIAKDFAGRVVLDLPLSRVGDLEQVRAALGAGFNRTA